MKLEHIEVWGEEGLFFGCVFCFLLRVKLIPDPGQVLGYGSYAYRSGEKDGRDSGREMHTHTHARTHTRAHTHKHTYTHVRTHTYTHTCAHTHTYAHTTHTYTHTHTTSPGIIDVTGQLPQLSSVHSSLSVVLLHILHVVEI